MKKIHLIQIAALLVLCCVMLGCGKAKQGSIYGTVTDFVTGDPVGNANVRLNPRGETTLTGSDGTFQFNDVTDGKYSLSLSKNGYVDLDDDYVINIENGNGVRRDVQLSPEFKSFVITYNGIEVDTLDFGSDVSYTKIGLLLTNNGTLPFGISRNNFSLSSIWLPYNPYNYNSSSWLRPNEGIPIKIEIDRSRLSVGDNIGYVYVNVETISKVLVVKAKRISK